MKNADIEAVHDAVVELYGWISRNPDKAAHTNPKGTQALLYVMTYHNWYHRLQKERKMKHDDRFAEYDDFDDCSYLYGQKGIWFDADDVRYLTEVRNIKELILSRLTPKEARLLVVCLRTEYFGDSPQVQLLIDKLKRLLYNEL